MAACRDELRVAQADLENAHFLVACAPTVRGCGALRVQHAPLGEITSLFVDPDEHGKGIGRALWCALLAVARAKGVTQITLDADPAAEVFYLRMGCRTVGQSPSGSIPGRMLPRMTIAL
jgi:N-acetylglutamate synthase-like GNAT family acetyltransferase